jgi:hypothetical protein
MVEYLLYEKRMVKLPPIPCEKYRAITVSADNHIFVIGGTDSNSKKSYKYSIYDRKWEEIQSPNTGPRDLIGTGCAVDNKWLYIFSNIEGKLHRYSIGKNEWGTIECSAIRSVFLKGVSMLQSEKKEIFMCGWVSDTKEVIGMTFDLERNKWNDEPALIQINCKKQPALTFPIQRKNSIIWADSKFQLTVLDKEAKEFDRQEEGRLNFPLNLSYKKKNEGRHTACCTLF